jgi:aspartate kinase
LAEKGINIHMITTSEIKISALVSREMAAEALRAVHDAFQLHSPPPIATSGAITSSAVSQRDPEVLLSRLQRMEKLVIEGIDLDETQSRVTFVGLPDIPGLAAQTFDELAEAGVVVDMIVQSIGREDRANISVTVPRDALQKTIAVAANLAQSLGCPAPTHCEKVAKLSVFGVGMKSHTDVAARMFQSLAAAGVNVELISSSEVRVNVVIDAKLGHKALAALKKEFADVMA